MHLRIQMILRVQRGEITVSGAAREYGVCRNTVRKWLERNGEESLENLKERSRRPQNSPNAIPQDLVEELLRFKAKRPVWGAAKLMNRLWGEALPFSVRTGDRILERHGLTTPRGTIPQPIRFERSQPNELLQMDFKGLGRHNPGYSPLTILDDATRFCLALRPLPNHWTETILQTLWDVFGEFGLPEAVLTDNEPCFADTDRVGPSRFEAQLWLLGVDVRHGRPLHPQTQGKVERFHRTIELELGSGLRQPTIDQAERVYASYLHEYNYERPHDSLGLKTPGELYRPSMRPRPSQVPKQDLPPQAIARKVDASGKFRFKSHWYRGGTGLIGQYVELREEEHGYAVLFTGRKFANLEDLRV